MGMSKKVADAKESFIVLCQQYSRMGEHRAAEMVAISNSDSEGFEAAAGALQEQYKEMGNQLIVLGRALDNLGGASVLRAPEVPA